ncbi:MAG: hypothetical protein VCD66_05005, partial [Alphaproteobacteria bacterium]
QGRQPDFRFGSAAGIGAPASAVQTRGMAGHPPFFYSFNMNARNPRTMMLNVLAIFISFQCHSREGGNPWPVPVALDSGFRGSDSVGSRALANHHGL